MPRCGCRGDSIKITDGRHVHTSGIGSPQDPLVVDVTTDLDVTDNQTFNLKLTGSGTLDSPWRLEVQYAPTARLVDLPDVDGSNTTNGYTLVWNAASGHWEVGPPSTAVPGAISHGNGLSGDGSSGSPLAGVADNARYVQVSGSGFGLTDAGINRLLRIYLNATARSADPVAPVPGAVSVLTTDPSSLWVYDGTTWVRAGGVRTDVVGQFLALSGNYAGGPVTQYVRQIGLTTSNTGTFTAIPAADLSAYSGVLSVMITPTGPGGSWIFGGVAITGGTTITAVARRTDGSSATNTPINGTVQALLY